MNNVPIQMLSLCGADGKMEPIRFRFEDEAHQMHTVKILEILDTRQVAYVGIEAFRYLCKTEEEGRHHVFELCYTVRSHRWNIFRRVY